MTLLSCLVVPLLSCLRLLSIVGELFGATIVANHFMHCYAVVVCSSPLHCYTVVVAHHYIATLLWYLAIIAVLW